MSAGNDRLKIDVSTRVIGRRFFSFAADSDLKPIRLFLPFVQEQHPQSSNLPPFSKETREVMSASFLTSQIFVISEEKVSDRSFCTLISDI